MPVSRLLAKVLQLLIRVESEGRIRQVARIHVLAGKGGAVGERGVGVLGVYGILLDLGKLRKAEALFAQ